MPRKLKTYITNLGFFELALTAPSMKAALEAWGMGHNAFHQGFAQETHDPKIIAATMEKPGVVLKRPVGTKAVFSESAKLPKDWSLSPPVGETPKGAKKQKARAKRSAKTKKQIPQADRTQRAAIISFKNEKARRERERKKQEQHEEVKRERERAARQRVTRGAQAALDSAQDRHEKVMAAIELERDKLDHRQRSEKARWAKQRNKLMDKLREAES